MNNYTTTIEPENNDLNLVKYETIDIKSLIHCIRGKQVMLDSDVAMLYHYETKKINQAVKRNIDRFPEKFCFQLTEEEFLNLRSQIVTLNEININAEQENNWSQFVTSSKSDNSKHRGKKYLPYVFTEQGIAMLSGLLKNDIAVQVSIHIMDAFAQMRKFISINGQVFERLTNVEYKLLEYDNKFKFHDRFIIIDNKDLYHCGASLKDLGKKCFGINKIINF